MRILILDCDTLRPDHLGCYGYQRDTSPNIDSIAARGLRFDNCYVPDAPCLPSRAALHTGRFGYHNGVVNHGGLAADLRPIGARREFANYGEYRQWIEVLGDLGYYTVSFSPFAQRHSAWWFTAGFREFHNPHAKRGQERADEMTPPVLDWLDRRGRDDNWLVHVNFWDPHTTYRTPKDYGNPFADQPLPAWHTEELLRAHCASWGPHSAMETVPFWWREGELANNPDAMLEIPDMDAYRRWIDGYDTGIHYMDHHIGLILQKLQALGVLDDTMIVVTSDHGENHGELNIYGDHMTADNCTSRVPFIVAGPGLGRAGEADAGLHYQFDLAATLVEHLGGQSPARWDAQPMPAGFAADAKVGRDYLVISNQAWSCQRSVRWGDWLLMRTYHSGLKKLPARMLFNLAEDPHLQNDRAEAEPDVVNAGLARLAEWSAEMLRTNEGHPDPMQTVLDEGGPYHTRGHHDQYVQFLRERGFNEDADRLEANPRWVED